MEHLLEHLMLEQQRLEEGNWGKFAAGIALAGSLLLNNPDAVIAHQPTNIQQVMQGNVVAKVLAGEGGGEGEQGMAAIGCVIQNRMKQSGKSAEQVVKSPHQFSVLNKPEIMNRNYKEVKKEADHVASKIGSLSDITNGATNYVTNTYYAKHKNQGWLKNMKITRVIGHHTFLAKR